MRAVLLLALLNVVEAGAQELELRWNEVSGASGYYVKYATKADLSDAWITRIDSTSARAPLGPGRVYIAVTAFGPSGEESPRSKIIRVDIPKRPSKPVLRRATVSVIQ